MENFDPIQKNNVTVAGNLNAARSIVLVHGFGTDQGAWQAVAAPFLKDFRIILFDNVGAGQSDPKAFVQHRYLNLHGYANDLLDICERLQLADAIFVGHSLGGMVCLLATLRKPECCARLVMIGASPRYLDDEGYCGGFSEAQLNDLYQSIELGDQLWADHYAPLVMANPEQPALARDFSAAIKRIPAHHVLTVLCSIFQSDHRAELGKLDKPTLLIQAREDVAVPLAVAHYLHDHIKDSRLAMINATGHLPHISAPEQVVAAMREFIYA